MNDKQRGIQTFSYEFHKTFHRLSSLGLKKHQGCLKSKNCFHCTWRPKSIPVQELKPVLNCISSHEPKIPSTIPHLYSCNRFRKEKKQQTPFIYHLLLWTQFLTIIVMDTIPHNFFTAGKEILPPKPPLV